MPGALSKRLIAARHLIEDHVVSKESRPFQRPEIRCLHAVIDRREKVFVIFLLHLIKFDLGTTLGGTIAADAGATQLTGTLDGKVGYTLTGPRGEIVIYVGYPWCCKWWIICKPCTKDAEWTLVSWSPYSKTDTLLDKHQSVTVPLK